MANGNMGDLSMTLTLQSRVEDETRKIIQELNKVDASGKRAQEALNLIKEAASGIKGAEGIKSIGAAVAKLSEEIGNFSGDKKVLSSLDSVKGRFERIRSILEKSDTSLSIFANGVSKSANDANIALQKLSTTINEISAKGAEGLKVLGVGATDNIRQSLSTLMHYKTTLEQIAANGGVHPVTGQVASDVTKSSAYASALADAKRYYSEVSTAMQAEVDAEKRNEAKVESIIQQRIKAKQEAAQKEAEIERQRQEQLKISAQIAQENAKSETAWNEQRSKAFSDALKKRMQAEVDAEKNRQVSLYSNGFDTSVFEKRLAALNRMKEIQEKLAYYQPKMQYAWLDYESSVKFGNGNDPSMRHKEDELQRLRNIIADLHEEFNRLGGSDAFKNVDGQIKNLEQTIARLKESAGTVNLGKLLGLENKPTDEFTLAKQAAMAKEAHVKKQNELTAAFEKYFRVQEQVEAAEKRLAEATARTNRARQEAISASRQQAESLVRDRAKELEAQRKQLQGLFGSGKNILSVDELSQIRNAFSQITQELNTLRGAMQNLSSYSIKDLFSMGRGTSNYAPLVSGMESVLREKQEAITLERKHQDEIARTAAKARNDLASAFSSVNEEAKKMQRIVGDIKSLFLQGGLVFGAQQFFNSIVQTGGEIVQQHIALRSILGDVQKADELFAQTQQLALQSPFKFGELNRDVKQLAAFGVEADELYDTTKRLADIASGLGVSFERLGLAYGQVKARSWLDGKELRQFAYAGLPLLQKITDLYNQEGKNGKNNYTASDVKGMITKREVSFEDVQKVLWQMTDEGGQFYNMQFVLSETLLGRWNKLIDAWDIMLGKLADGKNVVGGVFSFAIDRVTDLILALDKLSPVVLSVGAVFAGKKIYSAVSSKTGIGSLAKNYTAEMNAQLKSYAIEQQKLVVEGKITQEKALQNVQARAYLLADDVSRANAMSRLALEGKLSILQMQKAVKEGLISKELINQLAIMGAITAKQEQIILGSGRIAATWSMVGAKIKTAFSAIGGWWTLGIGAIMGLWTSISGEMDAVKQKADSLRDPNSERMKPYYDILAQDKASNDTGLKKQVESMKDLLVKSNAYTKTIDEQISKAKSLSEQYEILRQGVDNAKNVAAGDADMIAGAIGASGGWKTGNPFNDTVEGNAQDMQKSMAEYQVKLASMDENTKMHLSSIADEYLSAADKTKTLEEKIRILAERGGASWQWFGIKVNKWNQSVGSSIASLGQAANKATSDINEIVKDDIPRIIRYLQDATGRYGDNFKKLCQEQPERFRTMLEEILGSANVLVPEIAKKLKELTGLTFNSDKGGIKDTPLNSIQRRVFANLDNNQKQYDLLSPYLKDGSYYESKNSVKTALQDLYNEYKSRKNGGATTQEINAAKASYDALWNAASKGLGYKYVPEDKKSNKDPKKTTEKEDAELKALQERVESFKNARQAYQARKPYMSWDDAKEEIYKLFPNVKGLNLDDYLGSLAKITPSDAWFKKSEERKKYLSTINKEKADWSLSEELKPEFERITADFNAALEEGASQFNLYKTLLEKTGSKEYAMQAFKNGALWNDESLNLAKQFKEMTGFEADIEASDATAKHYLVDIKGNQRAYDLWKKIVAIVKGDFTDALKEQAELIEKALSYEEQIASIEGKYDKVIEKANKLGDTRAAIIARQKKSKEIGDVNLKKFKNSEDYLNFYGAIYTLGINQAQKIAANIQKNLNRALADGSITAKEYGKEVEQLYGQLEKLSGVQPSFLNGGLNGVVRGMKNQGQSQMAAGQNKYDYYKNLFNQAEQGQDIGGMVSSQMGMKAGEIMSQGGMELMQGADGMESSISMINMIIHGINDLVQGLNDTFQDIKETATVLGANTDSDEWTDYNTFFSSFSSASNSATKGWDSLKEGNIGGVISGVVGSFTGWIKGIAQGHDQKLDNHIKIAEREEKLLKSISDNVETIIENTLGGIYSYKASDYTSAILQKVKQVYELEHELKDRFSISGKNTYSSDTYAQVLKAQKSGTAYDTQLASLLAQRDQLQMQRDAEDKKKNTDQSKLNDYDEQIEEMRLKIQSFAQDFLKSVYSIDMKSWASELTDTIVSAWSAGEDAVDAYREKVKDMVKDVTKNIVSQKIMEKALEAPLEYLTKILEDKGRLDETDMDTLAQMLYDIGDKTVPQIEGIFDALKDRGWDFRDNDSSSTTNSVKGITEETADLLASYINAIRLDVSVNRENVKQIAEAVTGLPDLNVLAESQLTALNQLVVLAEYRNGKLDDMYAWMRSVTKETGSKSLRMN